MFIVYNIKTGKIIGKRKSHVSAERLANWSNDYFYDDACPHDLPYDLCDKH
jgi:hypothetical protein